MNGAPVIGASKGSWTYFEVFECIGLEHKKVFTFPHDRFIEGGKDKEVSFELTEQQKNSFTVKGDLMIQFKHKTNMKS